MPAMRVMVTRRGRAAYPATAQRPLTDKLPTGPAAVMLWDTTRRLPLLALDFDAKNGHGPLAAARDAVDAWRLLTDAGLHPVIGAEVSRSQVGSRFARCRAHGASSRAVGP